MLLSVISSEARLKKLDRYKEISKRLALAKNLGEEEARALAKEGKAVVWIDFGLHSTERAHAQTAPLLAYKAVTEESEEMRAIRENVRLVLIPNINPDGTTLVVDWYRKVKGTPFEESSPRSSIRNTSATTTTAITTCSTSRNRRPSPGSSTPNTSPRSSTTSIKKRRFPRASSCRRSRIR
jgi:hypothetical protein